MPQTLDLSSINAEQHLESITGAFVALSPENKVILSADSDLSSTLSQFQEQYWGEFIWNPQQTGPSLWKGELSKQAPMQESIAHLMGVDHVRCDQLLVDGISNLGEGKTEEGWGKISDFIAATLRHFKMEEDVLFPAFEEATGMTQGPTMVMRSEHQQIRGMLEQLSEIVATKDEEEAEAMEETLMILIQQHNMKEENMLYPMSDQHLSNRVEPMLKKIQLMEV